MEASCYCYSDTVICSKLNGSLCDDIEDEEGKNKKGVSHGAGSKRLNVSPDISVFMSKLLQVKTFLGVQTG